MNFRPTSVKRTSPRGYHGLFSRARARILCLSGSPPRSVAAAAAAANEGISSGRFAELWTTYIFYEACKAVLSLLLYCYIYSREWEIHAVHLARLIVYWIFHWFHLALRSNELDEFSVMTLLCILVYINLCFSSWPTFRRGQTSFFACLNWGFKFFAWNVGFLQSEFLKSLCTFFNYFKLNEGRFCIYF